LFATKKEKGEEIYCEMRDKLSIEEDLIADSAEDLN
jgi:hypothetical protein